MVPLFFLQMFPSIQNTGIYFWMDNQAPGWCNKRWGYARLEILLVIMEAVFDLLHSHQLCLTVQYLPGQQKVWVDTVPVH